MIEIEETEHGYALKINDHVLLYAWDKGIPTRVARVLTSCRTMPYRNAIKTIIEDIGYSEESAKAVYMSIMDNYTNPNPNTVN